MFEKLRVMWDTLSVEKVQRLSLEYLRTFVTPEFLEAIYYPDQWAAFLRSSFEREPVMWVVNVVLFTFIIYLLFAPRYKTRRSDVLSKKVCIPMCEFYITVHAREIILNFLIIP